MELDAILPADLQAEGQGIYLPARAGHGRPGIEPGRIILARGVVFELDVQSGRFARQPGSKGIAVGPSPARPVGELQSRANTEEKRRARLAAGLLAEHPPG